MINKSIVLLLILFNKECRCYEKSKIIDVFAWKQISYDFNGVLYNEDSNYEKTPAGLHFQEDVQDSEKFFIQYNNVPIGFEVYGTKVIVTVPRRRYGIPSTLNYVETSTRSPALKPYPNSKNLVSVYRPRIDACGRLWMVDTGLLEIPGNRTQVQKPAIVIYDLKTDRQILKYELKDSDLVNERTPGGLTSITVDVTRDKCDDAFAYINDLATEGMIVFSLKSRSSWRLRHPSFVHDEKSLNFTVAGYVINWKDGLFSIALSEPDAEGHRTAFYHPLVSTLEFTVNTKFLQNRSIDDHVKVAGTKGPNTQSGSHDYHPRTKTLFFANVAQDAILCWRVDNKMAPENVGLAVQDHEKLIYISDLKVIGDDVWVLVNQMPIFVYSTFSVKDYNFFIYKANIYDLIRKTPCEKKLAKEYNRSLKIVYIFVILFLTKSSWQQSRRLGKFREVFAWKQLTYNIYGNLLIQDRFGDIEDNREKRATDEIVFQNEKQDADDKNWNAPPQNVTDNTSTPDPNSEVGRFFIQYNNLPMGVERVGERLFITVPRRRYGIPSTLNYIDLKDTKSRSPALRPYPDLWQARSLTSVYRTRADKCGRLWMVDTGLLEIPNNPQQLQTPSIVIFDLKTNKQILRYPLKASDIPAANTPTGLASITVDINKDCSDAYAYIVDLTTFGLIVYSLKENDSWRHTHAYFHFNPTAANLNIAGESFQWSDGIFSITLGEPQADGCRTAYFHPMISIEEFSVSTCVLKDRAIRSSRNYFSLYSYVGKRGESSQSTMHGYHQKSGAIFFADIGRDGVSCWNTGKMLNPSNVALLARDRQRMSYPSDLHVTDDEVWVMANTLPRFGYSRLDTNEYNFYIYSGNVNELIADTVCSAPPTYYS